VKFLANTIAQNQSLNHRYNSQNLFSSLLKSTRHLWKTTRTLHEMKCKNTRSSGKTLGVAPDHWFNHGSRLLSLRC